MPAAAALVGQVALVAGLAMAAVGILAVLPRALRVRRRAAGLRVTVVANLAEIQAALDALAAGQQEAVARLASLRRVLRWVRHPLVVAAIQWWWRRR